MSIFKLVEKKPDQKLLVHRHIELPGTLIARRLIDHSEGQPIQRPRQIVHYMTWNFNSKRNQWEAYCECKDTIFCAVATPEDEPFRKGRTW